LCLAGVGASESGARQCPAGDRRPSGRRAWRLLPSLKVTMTDQPDVLADSGQLLEAINQIMPYGRYAGRRVAGLPEAYLVRYQREGFPNSKLGRQLALIYEVKLNGLEGMLRPLLKDS